MQIVSFIAKAISHFLCKAIEYVNLLLANIPV